MSSTGIRRERSTDSRLADEVLNQDSEQINSEKIFLVTGEGNPNAAGIASNPTPAGAYLKIAGGQIKQGIFGNDFGIATLVDDSYTINTGITDKPITIINGEDGNDDVITSVNLGSHSALLQAEIMIQAGSQNITVREDINEINHILTPGSADVVLSPGDIAKLIFSPLLSAWNLVWNSPNAGGGGGTGLSEPVILGINELTPEVLPTTTKVSWNTKNPQHILLDKAIEFEFTNLPPTGSYEGLLIIIDIDGVGGFDPPLWPVSILNPPIIDTTANSRVSVMLYTIDGGGVVTHATTVGSSAGGDNLGSHIATQALEMNDFAIFLDLAKTHSILALSNAINYSVPVGGAHDFFVNQTDIPKFGITEFDVNSNVPLVMHDKEIFLDTAKTRLIKSITDGINIEVETEEQILFSTVNGEFLFLDEVNSGDRRIDTKQNRVTNIGKLSFTPTFDALSVNTSEIFETLQDGDLVYNSNGIHIFDSTTQGRLLTIGSFLGLGGNLQDIAVINLEDSLADPGFNGEIQMNGVDVKVFSGNAIRNLSDIGVSQEFFGPWTNDHDAGNFELHNSAGILYVGTPGIASTNPYTAFVNDVNLTINTPDTKTIQLSVNGITKMEINNSLIDFKTDLNMNTGDILLNDSVLFLDPAKDRLIKSSTEGIDISLKGNNDIQFYTDDGEFLVLEQNSATDRRLDVKTNRIHGIGKLSFTATNNVHTTNFAEIFETLPDNDLNYFTQGGSHIFTQDGAGTVLTIGTFAGFGGYLQDIAVINISDSQSNPTLNGEFQMNGNEVRVVSGGIVRNLSDVGVGDNLGNHTATQSLEMSVNAINDVLGIKLVTDGQIDMGGGNSFISNLEELRFGAFANNDFISGVTLNNIQFFVNNIAGMTISPAGVVVTNNLAILVGNLQLPNGSPINEFSTDGTLAGNSDVAVPTEQAVKTYVDNNGDNLGSHLATQNLNMNGFNITDVGSIVPNQDNVFDLGSFGFVWNELFATTTRTNSISTISGTDAIIVNSDLDLNSNNILDISFLSFLTGGTLINEFSTDGTLAGNSDVAVPTEQAVKTYVDATVGGTQTPWLSDINATGFNLLNMGSIFPISTNTRNIGDASLAFANIYVQNTRTDSISTVDDTGSINVENPLILNTNGISEIATISMIISGALINEFSTNVNLGTSDNVLSTQLAVKTYIDTAISSIQTPWLSDIDANSNDLNNLSILNFATVGGLGINTNVYIKRVGDSLYFNIPSGTTSFNFNENNNIFMQLNAAGIIFLTPLNMSGNLITNLLNPTNPQDGATKNYVDVNAANVLLSNLTNPTTIGADLVPNANFGFDLGSQSRAWDDIYADALIVNRLDAIGGGNDIQVFAELDLEEDLRFGTGKTVNFATSDVVGTGNVEGSIIFKIAGQPKRVKFYEIP